MDNLPQLNTRHDQLLERLQSRGWVDIQELCSVLAVSEATIRRDLAELERRGLLQRTHGGALAPRQITQEYPNADRLMQNAAEKARIGRAAAGLVKPGDAVYLDAGTTTLAVCRHLADRRDLTFITNGTDILAALSAAGTPKLFVTAGEYHDFNHSLTGPLAAESIRRFNVDFVFLSVSAVDLTRGQIAISSPALADGQRAMIEIAQKVVVVADHSKFTRSALSVIAPLSAVDHIVTDTATRGVLGDVSPDIAAKLIFA
ncbi:DeoR/GlpR family DNA-binding transcription regulator [Pseudomonas sp. GX19020]|uniref:DeoR/GlpR family DNA-binding transcription regulator n=1 Tax=Pseudomonadota TaxID=1224 RepID=UPI00089B7585|nr:MULTISPECIES: DeoR/GlpR family DNA-binding transcription regulator [Pseudomonadota]MCL4068018.1 DeoR/GlpR family DNA-binding transcription regulator [Pseudomonas sp. GX19020]SED73885.1 transcriptional regulator, DeoR family [Rhodobacter sp. 24-YEA-8]